LLVKPGHFPIEVVPLHSKLFESMR
jgi:hypothetical protein